MGRAESATDVVGNKTEGGTTRRFRLQPMPVKVAPGEPFKNDLLDRQEFGEALAASLSAIEGGGVFALDGRWGTGKTTFLRMFTQHLRDESFTVVEVNAWDTDHADEPLTALVGSLSAQVVDESQRSGLKQAVAKIIRGTASTAVRAGLISLSVVSRIDSLEPRCFSSR